MVNVSFKYEKGNLVFTFYKHGDFARDEKILLEALFFSL